MERINSKVNTELCPDSVKDAKSYIEGSPLSPDFPSSGYENPQVPTNEKNELIDKDQNIEGLIDKDLHIFNMLQEELQKALLEDPIYLTFLDRKKQKH